MHYKKLFFLAAFSLGLSSILAADEPQTKPAEPPAAKPANEQTEPVIPKRELKFDVSNDEESLPLQNVQEGMLDQRYVAIFRLKIDREVDPLDMTRKPGNDIKTYSRGIPHEPEFVHQNEFSQALRSLLQHQAPRDTSDLFHKERERIDSTFRIFYIFHISMLGESHTYHRFNKRISRFLSGDFLEKHPPTKEIDAKFMQNDPYVAVQFKLDKNQAIPGNSDFIRISLLAPTVEEAKQWTEGLLAYYDWALCGPAQQECLKVKNSFSAMLPKYRKALEKAEFTLEELQKDEEKLKEFEDMKPESITALITQRRMLSIDLVGINARIRACN